MHANPQCARGRIYVCICFWCVLYSCLVKKRFFCMCELGTAASQSGATTSMQPCCVAVRCCNDIMRLSPAAQEIASLAQAPVWFDVCKCRLFTFALLHLAVTPLSVSHQQPTQTLSYATQRQSNSCRYSQAVQEGPQLLPHVYLAACMNRSAASTPSNTCRQAGAEAVDSNSVNAGSDSCWGRGTQAQEQVLKWEPESASPPPKHSILTCKQQKAREIACNSTSSFNLQEHHNKNASRWHLGRCGAPPAERPPPKGRYVSTPASWPQAGGHSHVGLELQVVHKECDHGQRQQDAEQQRRRLLCLVALGACRAGRNSIDCLCTAALMMVARRVPAALH